jgi:hypothetical protein
MARAKIRAADALAIREAMSAGTTTIDELAARYGVHRATIASIATGKRWKWAGGPLLPRHTGPRSNTGFWGVTANGAGNRCWISIRIAGRPVSLGHTKCSIEGARRYDAIAHELGIPPEKLNFPYEIPGPS